MALAAFGGIAVVATSGTTNVGVIDDLQGAADVAASLATWFHVDGAYGGGGLFAAILVSASLWFLRAPVSELALSYQSEFRLRGLGVMGGLNLIILGGLLGLAGAWLAVARHLVEIQPR